jgi:hypothetical protein
MPRFVIPASQLPPTSASAQHIIRFRVISEDRNRISDWSPIFLFTSFGQIPFSSSTSYVLTSASVNGSTILDFIWSGKHIDFHDELDAYPHDVFVKWNNEGYVFYGTIVGNTLRILARTSPPSSSAQFMVQSPSYGTLISSEKPEISSLLKIVETDTIVY